MKIILAAAALALLQGCAQMYPNTAHRPECQFVNLKQGERLPHHCGDWGRSNGSRLIVRKLPNGDYSLTK